MKIVEERYLKDTISKLYKFIKGLKGYDELALEIDSFRYKPLQDLSFKTDIEFFDDISFVLSVITSIVSNPHISNKYEEVILRAELAPAINNEMFLQTIKDPTLWKEDGLDMIPEYVCYHQNIDELRIYENVFVCHVINLIEAELNKYNDFYVSIIRSFDGNNSLSLRKENSEKALLKLRFLLKKVKHIKNTRFYREITKKPLNMRYVHPTNILTKDRLYNVCFKFYRQYISYADKQSLIKDFRLYYFTLLMQTLKESGFTLKTIERSNRFRFEARRYLKIPKLTFSSDLFELTISGDKEYCGLVLEVKNHRVKGRTKSKHLLVFDANYNFNSVKDEYFENTEYTSIDAMSIWNMAHITEGDVEVLFGNPKSELQLVSEWVNSKINHAIGSKNIYSLYCPVCKAQAIEEVSSTHHCDECGSIYTFYTDNNSRENIWFIKLGRR